MKAMSAFRIGMGLISVFLGQYSDRYIGQVLSLGLGKFWLSPIMFSQDSNTGHLA
jgi:hypothetical protein